MKAVVTGAAGFVGAHLCRRLAADGHDVIALDVRVRPAPLAIDGVRYLQSDLRRTDEWSNALDGVDTVFHLASVHLSVRAREAEYHAVNVQAAVALANECRARGVRRLVHVGTVGIYGHVQHPPAPEDAPRHPGNPYERTKLAGEVAVAEAADRLGLDLRIIRPAWVYGPGCPRTARLLRTIAKGRFFYVGDGANRRHPVHVDDVVESLLLAAHVEGGARRDHIVAGPAAMTLRELVDACAAAIGAPPPTLRLPRPAMLLLAVGAEIAGRLVSKDPPFSRRSLTFFENDNAFDGSAARRDLGFVPRVAFADGLRRTVADTTWPLQGVR